MKQFICLQGAANLPPEWDELADNYFQQIPFLSHTEKYNLCQQRYYLCIDNGKLVSAAILYSLCIDILTFIKVKSPLRIHIVGIPCSVSSQGIFGNNAAIETLKKHIYEVEKGFILVLNLKEKPLTGTYASGHTLPTVVMSNDFTHWDNYVASLRSSYRRRLKLINQANDDLKFEKIHCSEFTEEMYLQYLEVYKKSSGKLERLSFDFFKHLPSDFMMTVCFKNNKTIGWNISLVNQNTYYFFMGGIDYKLNKTYNTYLRLLSTIIKDGIEKKSDLIELGQTAEVPKMRLGGKPIPLFMEAHHSNLIFNKLIKLFSSLLEYRRKLENARVLKKEII
jgi:Acetyltransferase (GNAT) domain